MQALAPLLMEKTGALAKICPIRILEWK